MKGGGGRGGRGGGGGEGGKVREREGEVTVGATDKRNNRTIDITFGEEEGGRGEERAREGFLRSGGGRRGRGGGSGLEEGVWGSGEEGLDVPHGGGGRGRRRRRRGKRWWSFFSLSFIPKKKKIILLERKINDNKNNSKNVKNKPKNRLKITC